jgi:hypothetical protein
MPFSGDDHPRPETVASQESYDFFVSSLNRHRHSVRDAGHRKHGTNVKAGWRTDDKYLSRAKVRDHLRGRGIYGCWDDFSTRWFAIDVDYHGNDIGYFLDVLRAINDLRDFSPQVRWLYVLNRAFISGLHLVGLLPKPRLLDDIRAAVTACSGRLFRGYCEAGVQFVFDAAWPIILKVCCRRPWSTRAMNSARKPYTFQPACLATSTAANI